jgi:hypothetical protein
LPGKRKNQGEEEENLPLRTLRSLRFRVREGKDLTQRALRKSTKDREKSEEKNGTFVASDRKSRRIANGAKRGDPQVRAFNSVTTEPKKAA